MEILLPPVYHCRVKAITDIKTGDPILIIDPEPLLEGMRFEVMYFSHVANHWLTTWRQGGKVDFYVGQTLWRGKTPIASGGGLIPLYTPPPATPGTPPTSDQSIWKMVDPLAGKNGLSLVDAQALQDPKNFTYLIPKQEVSRLDEGDKTVQQFNDPNLLRFP